MLFAVLIFVICISFVAGNAYVTLIRYGGGEKIVGMAIGDSGDIQLARSSTAQPTLDVIDVQRTGTLPMMMVTLSALCLFAIGVAIVFFPTGKSEVGE